MGRAVAFTPALATAVLVAALCRVAVVEALVPAQVSTSPRFARRLHGAAAGGWPEGDRDLDGVRVLQERGCVVYDPVRPQAVVHFIGGWVAGVAPELSYASLLRGLARGGLLVCASRIPFFEYDHLALGERLRSEFASLHRTVLPRIVGPGVHSLPLYGLGHSLGCKLHVLGDCQAVPDAPTKAGNVLMSWSNLDASHARDITGVISNALSSATVPASVGVRGAGAFARAAQEQFLAAASQEFNPAPEAVLEMVRTHYRCPATLLVSFRDDRIDQSQQLAGVLRTSPHHRPAAPAAEAEPIRSALSVCTLPGTHTTPNLPGDEGHAAMQRLVEDYILRPERLRTRRPRRTRGEGGSATS